MGTTKILPETSDDAVRAKYKQYRKALDTFQPGDANWERFRALEEEMGRRRLW